MLGAQNNLNMKKSEEEKKFRCEIRKKNFFFCCSVVKAKDENKQGKGGGSPYGPYCAINIVLTRTPLIAVVFPSEFLLFRLSKASGGCPYTIFYLSVWATHYVLMDCCLCGHTAHANYACDIIAISSFLLGLGRTDFAGRRFVLSGCGLFSVVWIFVLF